MFPITSNTTLLRPPGRCYEVHRGLAVRRDHLAVQRRAAQRVAHLLEPLAVQVGAWVSTEALVRLHRAPETSLRPAVVMAAGDPPYDGVVEGAALLVVEISDDATRWAGYECGALWMVTAEGVTVLAPGGDRHRLASDAQVQIPGYPKLVIAASALARAAAT